MEDFFIVSLVVNGGIIGGGITAYSTYLEYKTNKITVYEDLKLIKIAYADILSYSVQRSIAPIVSIITNEGKEYRFLSTGAKRFATLLDKKGVRRV